ncbi:hypothetical protein CEXT_233701 [Caerostris extrusa]|uniref:Uncharacterized protein n=1 Tax=Caerostris extrusa TaxID=172846 RepID=A0AAV4VXL4_CAEEX|nr:hypothetical protein CEXT_233701 [Caerostris extrusa]
MFSVKTQLYFNTKKKKKSLTPACTIFPHLKSCEKNNPSLPPACLNISIPTSSASFKTETMGHRFSHFYEPTLSNPINFCREVSAEEGSRKIFCLNSC